MKNISNKAFSRINKLLRKSEDVNWKNNEYFDHEWKNRIKIMSEYINDGDSVTDFGCGEMWLKDSLNGNKYFGVDYVKRDDYTIICDFNKKQFPENISDVAFVSGCLEYIEDVKWFVKKISETNETCILSYCTTEYFPNKEDRKRLAWKNHMSRHEIISLFEKNSLFLKDVNLTKTKNEIFVFKK